MYIGTKIYRDVFGLLRLAATAVVGLKGFIWETSGLGSSFFTTSNVASVAKGAGVKVESFTTELTALW